MDAAALKTRLLRPLVWLVNLALLALGVILVAFAATYLATPDHGAASLPVRLLVSAAFLAGPAWTLFGILARRPQAWTPCAAFAASLVVFVVWLKRDDPAPRHPTDHPALRSDFPGAAATHALVLRYSKNVPGSLYDTVKPTAGDLFRSKNASFAKPGTDAEWIALVAEKRAAIETRWDELAPLRAWIDELAAAPELADLLASFDDPIPAFAPLREATRYADARALLHALDGRPDEAVALLLPVFTAGQKLEVHGRTLVRRMIAIVMQRQMLASLRLVLDHSEVSPATRARIAAALAPLAAPEENARLLFLCEYRAQAALFDQSRPQAAVGGEGFIPFGGLLLNPNATLNLSGDILTELADLSARRDLDGLKAREAAFQTSLGQRVRPRKNLAGHRLVAMATPAFQKVSQNFWEAQDWRAALLKRL